MRLLFLGKLAPTIFIVLGMSAVVFAQSKTEKIVIDANAATTPFPHFWEESFGSGHAILTLREGYRKDLRQVKQATGLKYVRFHGILDDEVGVYSLNETCAPVYNYSYVDQIYDGLLQNGVRPIVEISFMPKKLAANPDDLHSFWYKQNVSPPKSWVQWDDLVTNFAHHLVTRYGINEVSQWYFEVWNEPNIDFWGGVPRQQTYFDLYDHTAHDLKSVSPRLRVGGPATAHASWIAAFLKHVTDNHVPIDFVSTHGYADDTVENLLGTNENIPADDRLCKAVAMVKNQIETSASPHLPLLWTEWNVQGMDASRDTPFVGPAVANTIRECDGKTDIMSFWTFDDVFEEDGVIRKPFDGGFGLIALGGIKKPSFYDFSLLHKLGDLRLVNPASEILVTRKKDGTLAIALWNLVDPGKSGTEENVDLVFQGVPANATVTINQVDAVHGNPIPTYHAMGSPQYPTLEQVKQLNAASALPKPTQQHLDGDHLDIRLSVNALVLLELAQ